MDLSVVILSMTKSEDLFNMTYNCINSLIDSEDGIDIEIILVESNKEYEKSDFKYPGFVKVIIPQESFNFNKFLNIGIKEASGNYIALCNNDLIFQDRWFSEILVVAENDDEIMSFSPIGKPLSDSINSSYEIGYKVMTHIKGWCIVVKRELFQKIGMLDETFDFYFADNDYAMTLRSKNIKHALVFKSHVIHLEKQSSDKKGNVKGIDVDLLSKYKIPKYLHDSQYLWVFNNEKNLSGFLKFHNKWGTPNWLYRKNKLADVLMKNKLGYFNRFYFKIKI